MKILALDFSSSQRTVAVFNPDDGLAHEVMDVSTGRDMKPFSLIESALEKAGLKREDIECIAVGIGPGSYTGIRVAISLAQGWQLATGVKILGISSADCIASRAVANGVAGRFCVAIDAQRGEFYVAAYENSNGVARQVEPLKLATLAEVQAREAKGELLTGPEVTRWFPSGKLMFPLAGDMARLASSSGNFLPGEKLEPIYLRETTFVKSPPTRTLTTLSTT